MSLILRSGKRLSLRTGFGEGDAMAKKVRARMERALEAHRAGEQIDLPGLLARGAEPVSAWLSRLRGLAAGVSGGHRSSALPSEALWAVVENAAAPPALRIGAASVLADVTQRDPAGSARLGAAAEAAALPELARALRIAIAGGGVEEAELERAIEAATRAERAGRGA